MTIPIARITRHPPKPKLGRPSPATVRKEHGSQSRGNSSSSRIRDQTKTCLQGKQPWRVGHLGTPSVALRANRVRRGESNEVENEKIPSPPTGTARGAWCKGIWGVGNRAGPINESGTKDYKCRSRRALSQDREQYLDINSRTRVSASERAQRGGECHSSLDAPILGIEQSAGMDEDNTAGSDSLGAPSGRAGEVNVLLTQGSQRFSDSYWAVSTRRSSIS